MRKIMLMILPLCILYFLVGAILVWTKILNEQTYLSGAGIVGGLASVLGLISFLRPAISRSDIQNIEAESLQKLADVSSEIKKLEETKSIKANQIDDLEAQRKEMELLVRKASMSLFLKEQYSRHSKGIQDHLQAHPEIVKSLDNIATIKSKLDVLDEEIESDPNVELLKLIMATAKTRKSPIDIMIENTTSPFLRTILRGFKVYVNAIIR